MSTAITTSTYRPSLLGSRVFDDMFNSFFTEFPKHLRQSTQGYPVADIYRDDGGNTVMEFALAGFSKDNLTIDIKPDQRSIKVSATFSDNEENVATRRIARRSFEKTYVNYDNDLDLNQSVANFENGLLTITIPRREEMKSISVKIK